MKIELNIDEILGSEQSIRDAVVSEISERIRSGIGRTIEDSVSELINKEVAKAVSDRIEELITCVLDEPYTMVDRWGDRTGKPTTFRKELVKAVNEQMVYRKGRYDSDSTPFAKAVDGVVESNVKNFKAEFDKLVNEKFTQEALRYAEEKLRQKLGIK